MKTITGKTATDRFPAIISRERRRVRVEYHRSAGRKTGFVTLYLNGMRLVSEPIVGRKQFDRLVRNLVKGDIGVSAGEALGWTSDMRRRKGSVLLVHLVGEKKPAFVLVESKERMSRGVVLEGARVLLNAIAKKNRIDVNVQDYVDPSRSYENAPAKEYLKGRGL